MNLEIITIVEKKKKKLIKENINSVKNAIKFGKGNFVNIKHIIIDENISRLGAIISRNNAIKSAYKRNIEWLFFLDVTDIITLKSFIFVKNYLKKYDAIWGQIVDYKNGEKPHFRLPQYTPQSIEDLVTLPFDRTILMGHFVKTNVAIQNLFSEDMSIAEDVDYYLRVWNKYKCVKIEKPIFIKCIEFNLSIFEKSKRIEWAKTTENIQKNWRISKGIDENTKFNNHFKHQKLLSSEFLEAYFKKKTISKQNNYYIKEFQHRNKKNIFVITNPFDLIQYSHLSNRFHEEKELKDLERYISKKMHITEIGGNTGNHTIFYANYWNPKSIKIFEPNQEALVLLKKNIQLNKIQLKTKIDIYPIGLGLKNEIKYTLNQFVNNLGVTRLVSSSTYSNSHKVNIEQLDQICNFQIDFMKIDVEGMEMDVLRGAEKIINDQKPLIFIEIHSKNLSNLAKWTKKMQYYIVLKNRRHILIKSE